MITRNQIESRKKYLKEYMMADLKDMKAWFDEYDTVLLGYKLKYDRILRKIDEAFEPLISPKSKESDKKWKNK